METNAYLTKQEDATEKFAKTLGTSKSIYDQKATTLPQQKKSAEWSVDEAVDDEEAKMFSKIIKTDDEIDKEVSIRVQASAPKLDKEELHKEMKALRDGQFDGLLNAEEEQAQKQVDLMEKMHL